jgi:diketogulonate reductase-like aldo/keto reductase
LSPKAQELLIHLAKANSSIELADILHHLNIQASSYESLKKKRKKLMDEIFEKLQKHIGDKTQNIFIINRSSADKRHKMIGLNPKLIHIKK